MSLRSASAPAGPPKCRCSIWSASPATIDRRGRDDPSRRIIVHRAACPHFPIAPMHYDAHQPVIDDLEARILTLRDSL
jgi:hypothetical protein